MSQYRQNAVFAICYYVFNSRHKVGWSSGFLGYIVGSWFMGSRLAISYLGKCAFHSSEPHCDNNCVFVGNWPALSSRQCAQPWVARYTLGLSLLWITFVLWSLYLVLWGPTTKYRRRAYDSCYVSLRIAQDCTVEEPTPYVRAGQALRQPSSSVFTNVEHFFSITDIVAVIQIVTWWTCGPFSSWIWYVPKRRQNPLRFLKLHHLPYVVEGKIYIPHCSHHPSLWILKKHHAHGI